MRNTQKLAIILISIMWIGFFIMFPILFYIEESNKNNIKVKVMNKEEFFNSLNWHPSNENLPTDRPIAIRRKIGRNKFNVIIIGDLNMDFCQHGGHKFSLNEIDRWAYLWEN